MLTHTHTHTISKWKHFSIAKVAEKQIPLKKETKFCLVKTSLDKSSNHLGIFPEILPAYRDKENIAKIVQKSCIILEIIASF